VARNRSALENGVHKSRKSEELLRCRTIRLIADKNFE
jgi:hypothetical protein